MSNRSKIYGKGRIEGPWTGIRHEVLNSPAWKSMNAGARLLYIALLRRLSFKAYNNGHVYLSTRKAAEEIGASQRMISVWYKELEFYGFIVMTEPGCLGPKGRAAHWRITDMAWGELDGKPIKATKDYMKWDGIPFRQRPQKQKNGEKKYSARREKVLTAEEKKYSAPTQSEEKKYSYTKAANEEKKYSNLDLPSPIPEGGLPEGHSKDGVCAHCGGDGETFWFKNGRRPVWLHRECRRFWRQAHGVAS